MTGTFTVKSGMAQMLKVGWSIFDFILMTNRRIQGGVIMDVVNAEQVCLLMFLSVFAYTRLPGPHRRGGWRSGGHGS